MPIIYVIKAEIETELRINEVHTEKRLPRKTTEI